jgi:hypothetical protein
MTARDLITRALRSIGVLAQGESPTAAEAQDALLILQDLLNSWGVHRQTIYTIDRSTFAVAVGTQDYTLGTWEATTSAPTAPVITQAGTPGTTAYQYQVVAVLTSGEATAASVVGSTATGAATLGLVNYNTVTWAAVTGAATYQVYRTLGGPTTGLIASGVVALSLGDTGLVADGATAPLSAVGPPSHWEHVRPVWIDHASLRVLTNATQPLELPLEQLTVEDWQQVRIKAVSSTIPRFLYENTGWPYTTISIWPIPTDATSQIVLYLPVAVTGFLDLSTDYSVPPGYGDALRYQLAVRLAPEFGRQVDPQIAALAADSLAAIKRVNREFVEARVDPTLVGAAERRTFNWLLGQ